MKTDSPVKLSDFDAFTFDCYGTLIDWERGIADELRPWTLQHGLKFSDDELLETFAKFESRHQAETPDKLYPTLLASVYRDMGAHWAIAVNEQDAIAFGKSIGRWPAFDDSATSLLYLKNHHTLVILSNVDRTSFALSNKKLGVTFDKIVTAQDVGSYKPDPRNFKYAIHALAEIGITKEKILHTAQSLFHDIVPAKAAGLTTMWINRRKGKKRWGATAPPSGDVKPDFEAASLAEFVSMHQAELHTTSSK